MIYLLTGTDDFRIRERVEQIHDKLKAGNLKVERLYREGNKISLEELQQILSTQQLLANSQLIIINNLLSHTTNQTSRWLNGWFDSEDSSNIELILLEAEPLLYRNIWNKYIKNWIKESYLPLSIPETKEWLKQRVKKEEIMCSPMVIQQIVANFGNDLWRISNELNKLALFTGGQNITPDILKELTSPVLPDNIWLAIDALANKNMDLANKLLNTQIMLGASEAELLTMVAYQFRNIAMVKTLTEKGVDATKLAAQTGLHPYVVKKSLSFARQFTWSQLKRIFHLLQKIDMAIKQGKTPSRVGLDILIAQIVSC